jgi:fimbrial chaperone protein
MAQTKTIGRVLTRLALAVAFISSPAVLPASAATFRVMPTQLTLGGKTQSGLLTIRNDSGEPLRFQISIFAWQQTPAGEMALQPTADIVFFPALFTLNPAEERSIRVGSRVASTADVEQTYRIFVEELPPLDRTKDASAVRVLTKMGIPIFIRPAKYQASAKLAGLEARSGTLSFQLSNTGAVHLMPFAVAVQGLDGGGNRVYREELKAWYVLAGGRRDFTVAPPAQECGRIRTLIVEADVGFTTLTERLPVASGVCAP